MTSSCSDCRIPTQQHAALVAALRAGALSEPRRNELVAAALAAPRSLRRPWLLAAVAMAAVGVAVSVFAWPEDREPAPAWTSIETERQANDRYLQTPQIRDRLAAVAEGTFVAIVGGGTFDSDTSLTALLARIDRKHPHARHRYVFRRGTRGPRQYTARTGAPPFLSGDFINRMRLGTTGTKDGRHVIFRLAPGQRLGPKMAIPANRRMVVDRHTVPLRIGPPGTSQVFRFDAAYRPTCRAPIVLPDGIALPRFEIPGSAELTLATGTRTYRRYLIAVSVPELSIEFEPTEALGRPTLSEQTKGAIELGGQTFRWLTEPALRRARAAERPVLVVTRPGWLHRYPGDPFERLPEAAAILRDFERFWREGERSPMRPGTAATTAAATLRIHRRGHEPTLVRIEPDTRPEALLRALRAPGR